MADIARELTTVYLLEVTELFWKAHWAFKTVLLAHPSCGVKPELTLFCHFAGMRNPTN